MDQTLITRIVEAALLAANQPLTLAQLHGLFPLDEPAPDGSVERALEALREGCAERGVELVEVASGWRFQVQADVHPWIARLWTERQTKYTRATLETLALIAYRQPITRGEIEQVRGVAVNSNIIKALEEREWIRVVGHRDIPGRPELLGTTRAFLDYFGLKRLDELPPLSELKDFGELEPQFRFEGGQDAGAMPVGDLAADTETDTGTETGATGTGETEAAGVDDAGTTTAEPEHDTVREERVDGDPAIADADADETSAETTTTDDIEEHALADDGDSTRSTT
jgi:segregation and condensation protein B